MWTQNSQGHRGKKGRTKPAPKSASGHLLTQQSPSLPGKHVETTSSAIKDSLLSCLSPDTAVEGRNEPHGASPVSAFGDLEPAGPGSCRTVGTN